MLNFENLKLFNPISDNTFNIPKINGVDTVDTDTQWIPFNYVMSNKAKDKKKTGVHFFIDDYQFQRLWNNPQSYLNALRAYKYVLSPDFSMYTDMPKALQIYNHYRKHWVAAYLEQNGINVIPTICWSDNSSFEWCFDGEPHGKPVAISTVGCMKYQERIDLFMQGYEYMKRVLKPSVIICHGMIPDGISDEVIRIPTFYESLKERANNGR